MPVAPPNSPPAAPDPAAAAAPHATQAAPAHLAVTFQQYVDLDAFSALAVPLLLQDVLRNTLCLTHLASIQQQTDAAGRTLALLSCDSCNLHAVLVSGHNRGMGYSTCYVSVGCRCRHLASQLASVLEQQLTQCDKITLTAAAAEVLLGAQSAAHRWQLDHTLQLMVYAGASRVASSNQQAGPAAAAPLPASPAPEQQHSLQLQKCSMPADTDLIVSWAASFLEDVFGLHDRPSDEQVKDSVLPRLQQGLYFLLRDSQPASSGSEASGNSSSSSGSSSSGTAVCLVSHSPSSGSSTRITMVYTPPEQRGRGHAKTAVRQLLDKLQAGLGYSCVCLFADNHKPHISAMYRGLGFKDADKLHTLKRPVGGRGPSTHEGQAALN